MNTFLLTFRLFGSPEDLFSILIARYTMHPPPGLSSDEHALWTNKKFFPIQSRVAIVLKVWLEFFWIDQYDDVCLDDIHRFANGAMKELQPEESEHILELVSAKVQFFDVLNTNMWVGISRNFNTNYTKFETNCF